MPTITKQFYLLVTICLLAASTGHAQLKIGNNPTSINSASLLEMESANKGLVLPRVSLTALATAAPLEASLLDGTLVYNTNASLPGGVGIYIWRTTLASWQQLVVSGNASTTLNGAYNYGGAGVGRTITADAGAVKIAGNDGLLVSGQFGTGATIETFPTGGPRMFFNPRKAAFRAGSVIFNQWDNSMVGDYSTAMGVNTTAAGTASIAMGSGAYAVANYAVAMGGSNSRANADNSLAMINGQASGNGSVAIGNSALTSGESSFALGAGANAQGNYSMAVGNVVAAKSVGGLAVGSYNDNADNPNAGNAAATDRIFQLGNGTASTRSNAVTILRNGNTGIGVLAPQQKLEVDGQIKIMGGSPGTGKVLTSDVDGVASWVTPAEGITGITLDQAYDFGGAGSGRTIAADAGAVKITGTDGLLVTGNYNSGATIEVSGYGTRMFFNPRKAAFRAGYAMSSEWDNANVGQYSIGVGMGANAYGNCSVAMGRRASASEDAVAIGASASALSSSAIAMGTDASASGFNSIAIGLTALASNRSSIAMGESQNSNGISSTAIGGLRNSATGQQAATLGGRSNLASGNQSTAMGYYSWANGDGSLAVGYEARAKSFAGIALGSLNDDGDAPSASSAASTDRIFQIGNGIGNARSNAITVLRNGNTGVGVTNPATHKLEVNGSVRQTAYSQSVSIAANGGTNFIWTHNLGYQPIIILTLDQTGGGYLDWCTLAYTHLDNNRIQVYIANRNTGNAASSNVRWIVVY